MRNGFDNCYAFFMWLKRCTVVADYGILYVKILKIHPQIYGIVFYGLF